MGPIAVKEYRHNFIILIMIKIQLCVSIDKLKERTLLLMYKYINESSNEVVGFIPGLIQYSDLLVMMLPPANLDGSGDGLFQTYGFWVNDKRLVPLASDLFDSLPVLPESPFPFTRLAGLSPSNGSSFFIYHQLNASSFAEDQWDSSVGGWVSSSFTISMEWWEDMFVPRQDHPC